VVHGLEILTEVDSTSLEVSNSEIEEYKLETLQMLNATLIGLEQYKKTK
jgi:hypothetical protein